MTTRPELRAALRAAVTGDAAFSGFTDVPWGRSIDPDSLPAFSIYAPRTTRRRGAVGQYTRETDLVLLIRRSGGADMEDELDADAEVAEPLGLAAIDSLVADIEAVSADHDLQGEGERRNGSVLITFRIKHFD